MEPPFVLLEQVKTLLLQKKLSSLPLYEEAREDSQTAYRKFFTAHGAEIRSQVLDLLDLRDGAWSIQRDAAFCLGLQLGMELGRLERFGEPEG